MTSSFPTPQPLFDTHEMLSEPHPSNDIRDYLEFIHNPPKNWVTTKIAKRFLQDNMTERAPNPAWRPFVVKISKSARRMGQEPDKNDYKLSNKSIEAIFAVLSSLFSYLQQEEYLDINPVALIRQKKDTYNASWLRHTAISTEVEYRPRDHIRDDVGHENASTMDKYIDTDSMARHASAKTKRLKPGLSDHPESENIT